MTTTPPTEPAIDAAPVYAPVEYAAAPLPSKRLGLIAMLAAFAVLTVSIIVSIANGVAVAPLADVNPAGGWYYNADAASADPAESAVAVASLLHVLLGTLFGITALVLGIVAVATKRGRAPGVIAIVIAALAPFVTLIAFAATVTVSLPQ